MEIIRLEDNDEDSVAIVCTERQAHIITLLCGSILGAGSTDEGTLRHMADKMYYVLKDAGFASNTLYRRNYTLNSIKASDDVINWEGVHCEVGD